MSEQAPEKASVSVTIDGLTVEAEPGEMIITAAERHGAEIPHFCYHNRLSPVGMCRMCLVDVDTGRGPMLQPSCMVSVSEGMQVDTQSKATKRAQEGMLELLLVNHPLDCAVCDKGGECPLQDQTLAYGPGESRFVEEKRHYEKPIAISELVYLDRERCILCDRCTRFADEVAGDPLISFTERGNQTQVLTFPDDPFNSYFSGNVVQICPVGALTATPYRFKARPWDLDQVESTCTGCSVGCRVAVQSSRDRLVRYLGVDIDPVNHGWLCDKGRFGFEANNSENRLKGPYVRDPSDAEQLIATNWDTALTVAADAIRAAMQSSSGPGSIGIIGGSRSTNEDAYAWSKLARTVIGTDNVDAQLGDGLRAPEMLSLPRATIDDACSAATVLVIGPDLKEELPVLFLRLRGAAEAGSTRIVELASAATGLTPYAHRHIACRPGEAAVELATLLDSDDPLAEELRGGSVVVVLGRQSLAESDATALQAAGVVVDQLPHGTFLPVLRRANVRGAIDMGLSPGLLPGRVGLDEGREWFASSWGDLPLTVGLDTAGMLEAAATGRISTLVLLGADPLVDFPDHDLAARAIAGAGLVVAVDAFATESVRRADVVLATSIFGEKGGTTTNIEGRVSRLAQKVTAPGTVRSDWMIAAELARRLGGDLGITSLEAAWTEIEEVAISHAGLTVSLLEGDDAADGIVVPLPGDGVAVATENPDSETLSGDVSDGDEAVEVPPLGPERPSLIDVAMPDLSAAPAVDAYAFRLVTGRKLHDAGTLVTNCDSMSALAPEPVLRLSPTDVERLGIESGSRVNAISTRTTVVATVVTDAGVPRGTAVMAFNQPGQSCGALIDSSTRVTDIRVETR